ncbi:MAG: DNA-processing protein DprA [Candidatus Nealsonbacteria bacterium]
MEEIKKITINDPDYPKLLKKILNPPKVLYYKGNIKNSEPYFAIVGTRRYSSYGKQITYDITNNLTDSGFIIVSGLAPGIDTFAHTSVIQKKQKTIAILGTGLDQKSIYPKENIKLAQQIIEFGGCLISEYPPGTKGSRFTFPQRNRIISGISYGTLVIEAKEKSGSLITANYAFSQKRKVFAVPGSIFCLNSRGSHNLIKRGAKLVENANDILKELKLFNLTSSNKKEIIIETSNENLILNILKQQPLHLDKIIEKTKLDAPTISSILIILEINGQIKNIGENIYTLTH